MSNYLLGNSFSSIITNFKELSKINCAFLRKYLKEVLLDDIG